MSLLPLLKSMLHSLDSIESTTIWILRYFSIAVLLLRPFFFLFRCEMDWKTTNIRKGDWDWIRNGRTPRFFVRLQATNESGHLSPRRGDHPQVFVPRSCADHSWQLGGRIHTTRFKCKLFSIYKSTKSTVMWLLWEHTDLQMNICIQSLRRFFWIKFLHAAIFPVVGMFCWKSSKWRSVEVNNFNNLQRFPTLSALFPEVWTSLFFTFKPLKVTVCSFSFAFSSFCQAPCAAGGPGDGQARAQPHLAPGDLWRFWKNVEKAWWENFSPQVFFVTNLKMILKNHM